MMEVPPTPSKMSFRRIKMLDGLPKRYYNDD
jgi:hypothetical protein